MSREFVTTSTPTSTGITLELGGELNAASAPEALALIHDLPLRQGQQLVIDLAAITFCDSSGVSVLIAAHNLATAAQARMALAAVPAQLTHTFAMLGLAGYFPMYPTVDEAHTAIE